MKILGIETSCDETAAAVVENGNIIHSNCIYSQIKKHKPYGGVVPEIASRNHVTKLPLIIEQSLNEANTSYENIDAIAVTYGPGLASSLLVGFAAGKALSHRLNIPIVGVNHHTGHLYSVFMNDQNVDKKNIFPMLGLMVSGGDTSIILMNDISSYKIIGTTIDDAAGEALDKASAILNLGYPGGPIIQKTAEGGNNKKILFPRGLQRNSRGRWIYNYPRELCFSFSGLKTSLVTYVSHLKEPPSSEDLKNITASFQYAVVDALINRMENAIGRYKVKSFSCSGGVSLNSLLRSRLKDLSTRTSIPLLLSPPTLCTDNAAMIAGVAYEMFSINKGNFNPIDVNSSLRLKDWD